MVKLQAHDCQIKTVKIDTKITITFLLIVWSVKKKKKLLKTSQLDHKLFIPRFIYGVLLIVNKLVWLANATEVWIQSSWDVPYSFRFHFSEQWPLHYPHIHEIIIIIFIIHYLLTYRWEQAEKFTVQLTS